MPGKTVYRGSFQEGLRHGEGRLEWSDGTLFQGTFENGKPVREGKIALLRSVRVHRSNVDPMDAKRIGEHFDNVFKVINGAGGYEHIYRDELPPGVRNADVIDIVSSFEVFDGYRWEYSWPIIYPFPGIWPIQWKEGKVYVQFRIRITEPSGEICRLETEWQESEYTSIFYGFYRTGAIEDGLRKSLSLAFESLHEILTRETLPCEPVNL